MSDPKNPQPGRLLAGAAIVVVLVSVVMVLALQGLPPRQGATEIAQGFAVTEPGEATGTTVYGRPEDEGPITLRSLASSPLPSLILDVHQPDVVSRALLKNQWLRDVLTQPLGRGFVGTWAGFLGTRGEDVRAGFQGMVLDHLVTRVLNEPFRVVWFAGARVSGTPAVVLPSPGRGARAAVAALGSVATRGTYTAEGCLRPREENEEDAEDTPAADSEASDPPVAEPPHRDLEEVTIERWLLADHAIYVAIDDDRLVIGRKPKLVLEGMCAVLPELRPTEAVAAEARFQTASLGRGSQLMTNVLGLDDGVSLALGVEQEQLVPRGIRGSIANPSHLAKGQLTDQLLQAVPEDAPVVLTMLLQLPREMTTETMARYFRGESTPNETRQIAIIWYPHGRTDVEMDLAILWSQPKDRPFLEEMFSQELVTLTEAPVCGHLVLASGPEMVARVAASCGGESPSLMQAAPNIVAGWRTNLSVGLGLHLGRTLSTLALDAYWDERSAEPSAPPGALPPEMRTAQQQLEALPFFGLRGLLQGAALVPGGFRS